MNQSRWSTLTQFNECTLTNVSLKGAEDAPYMEFDTSYWLCAGQPAGEFDNLLGNITRYMVYVPERGAIFGTQSGGVVVRIDPAVEQVTSNTLATTDLQNICYDFQTGLIYIVDRTANTLYKVDPDTLQSLGNVVIGGGTHMVTTGGDGYLYVPSGLLTTYKVRARDLTVVGTYTHDQLGRCWSAGLSPDNATLYIAGNGYLWKVDTTSLTRLVSEQVVNSDTGQRIHVDATEQYCYFAWLNRTYKRDCTDCSAVLDATLTFAVGQLQGTTARIHIFDTDFILVAAMSAVDVVCGGVFRTSDLGTSGAVPYRQIGASDVIGDMAFDPVARRMWVSFGPVIPGWGYFNVSQVYADTSGEIVSEVRSTPVAVSYQNVIWDGEAAYAGGVMRPRVVTVREDIFLLDMIVDEPNGYFYTRTGAIFSKRRISDYVEEDSYDSGSASYQVGCLDLTGANLFISGPSLKARRIQTSDMTLQAEAVSTVSYAADMAYDPLGTYVYFAAGAVGVRKYTASTMAEVDFSTNLATGLVFDSSRNLYSPGGGTDLHKIDVDTMNHVTVNAGIAVGNAGSPVRVAGNYVYGLARNSSAVFRAQISPFTGGLSPLSLPNGILGLEGLLLAGHDEEYVYAFGTASTPAVHTCWRIKIPEFYLERQEAIHFNTGSVSKWSKYGFIREGSTIFGHCGTKYLWEAEVKG